MGPVYQSFKSELYLRGVHNSIYNPRPDATRGNSYVALMNDEAYGWLTGISYQTQTLKTSLTYRSEINHKFQAEETGILSLGSTTPGSEVLSDSSKVTIPQSVNFDISKKITDATTLQLNTRWINWKAFDMDLPYYKKRASLHFNSPNSAFPTAYDKDAYNPLSMSDDQWSINLGAIHQISNNWTINGVVGWDSGAGDYTSHYAPINGSWNAGLGVKFSPASNYFVETGIKYIWLDNVKGQHAKQLHINSNQYDTEFNDNYALSYDFKIGYRF